MPVRQAGEIQIWRRREPSKQMAIWFGWLCGVALFMFCWEFISERTEWIYVFDAPRIVVDIGSRMFPPRWSYIDQLWIPIWDTVNIATLGTLFAIVMAVPVALVSIVGPGLFAGIIAISLRSIGFVAKLLYEAIEEIDEDQVEAIEATGANRAQVIAYGIVPQIMPAFAGITVFRWDINIRESTVLGLVGAGGIGLQLQSSLNILAWSQVIVILLAILVSVVISEVVSAKVRHAII